MMHDGPLSTLDRMMRNPSFQRRFEEGEFLLSELVHAMMDDDEHSKRAGTRDRIVAYSYYIRATILSLLQELADGQQWQNSSRVSLPG